MHHLDPQTQAALAAERAAMLRATMVAGQRFAHTSEREDSADAQPRADAQPSLFRGFRTRPLQPGER